MKLRLSRRTSESQKLSKKKNILNGTVTMND